MCAKKIDEKKWGKKSCRCVGYEDSDHPRVKASLLYHLHAVCVGPVVHHVEDQAAHVVFVISLPLPATARACEDFPAPIQGPEPEL